MRAICTKTGIITTTTGVLFMKAEAMTTKAISIAMARRGWISPPASAAW
jgi:hypothetical protein